MASHYIYPIKTNDRSGVMYLNGEGKYTIYLAGELSKPLTIADPKDVIKFYINSSLSTVLTTKRDRLVFSNWLGTTMFNLVKKDISYDEKGQAKIYPGSSFYANGKFYRTQSDKTSSILTFDENFKLLSTTAFKLTPRYLESGAGTTMTGGVVRFWGFNNYQNTNSLQVTSLDLSK
ncbi:hypothetical protein [Paenibacillus nasutitermitis]|uniref:Uncharacterized protein n=1 Tax=Paenibacillus nasutitermitis TaxID=1652958 RepID=A0A917DYE4_9BACL|nr:hypothetical protein [Paenibacillus nasutitermitis]GGD83415.1 hypothetical protein GCM10010911_46970 [Paenibacillus nasutitermitis]